MADRLQTRLEQNNLGKITYVGNRLREIAVEYRSFLGGRSPETWLRMLSVELIRQADRLRGQSSLFDDPDVEPDDTVVELIMAAGNPKTLDRIRDAYADRWGSPHEAARHKRLEELAARW